MPSEAAPVSSLQLMCVTRIVSELLMLPALVSAEPAAPMFPLGRSLATTKFPCGCVACGT